MAHPKWNAKVYMEYILQRKSPFTQENKGVLDKGTLLAKIQQRLAGKQTRI